MAGAESKRCAIRKVARSQSQLSGFRPDFGRLSELRTKPGQRGCVPVRRSSTRRGPRASTSRRSQSIPRSASRRTRRSTAHCPARRSSCRRTTAARTRRRLVDQCEALLSGSVGLVGSTRCSAAWRGLSPSIAADSSPNRRATSASASASVALGIRGSGTGRRTARARRGLPATCKAARAVPPSRSRQSAPATKAEGTPHFRGTAVLEISRTD
jgi:hypothetical protein